MKKLLSIMLIFSAVTIVLQSCTSNKELFPKQQEIEVRLKYVFFESGNMTRNGESIYQQFFNDHIKTKELTPTTYSMNFINESKMNMKVSGTWDSKDAIKILEGDYTVIGTSTPSDRYVSNIAYLNFNEEIHIDKNTQDVMLNAKYDCFLLMFNAENIASITWKFDANIGQTDLPEIDNLYYIFVNQTNNSERRDLLINITRHNGTKIELNITSMHLENGKYYYFNDMTNSFDIEPMQNGNQ